MNVTFWESASTANLPVLQTITNAFNSSQTKVHVTLVTQNGYNDTWQKYTAGLSNGQLPDVVQLADQQTQSAVDTRSFLPVQSCMNAAKYPTSDYLPAPPRLLEGERRAVGPPLRRLGADPLLQRERLHEGRPQPGQPADHAPRAWWPMPRR